MIDENFGFLAVKSLKILKDGQRGSTREQFSNPFFLKSLVSDPLANIIVHSGDGAGHLLIRRLVV